MESKPTCHTCAEQLKGELELVAFRPEDIVCRACGISFDEPEGCDVCNGARQSMIWPALDSLTENVMSEAYELVKVSRMLRTSLKTQMKKMKDAGKDLDGKLVDSVARLLKSAASTLHTVSYLQEKEDARLADASIENQARAFVALCQSLPKHHRIKAAQVIQQYLLTDEEIVNGELIETSGSETAFLT